MSRLLTLTLTIALCAPALARNGPPNPPTSPPSEASIQKVENKQEAPAALTPSTEKEEAFLVAQRAIQAAEKGDFQTVIGLTDPQLVSAVGKDKIIRTLSRMKQKAKERGGMTQIEFSSEFGVEESISTVTLNLYFGDGTRDTKTVRLRKLEDKRWVITS